MPFTLFILNNCVSEETDFLPVNCNGQKMKNGGRATEDVTRGPHITEVVTESPLHADLKRQQNEEK